MRDLFYAAAFVFGVLVYGLKDLGLAPDPALYAGLGLKVFESGNYWKLSATENLFPLFFEHPPYFFQWGATLFSIFGTAEWVAKLMGIIPSLLGLLCLLLSMARLGRKDLGIATVFLLCVTGHFTKYATSSYLEGPLFLGVVLVYLASVDFYLEKWNWGSWFFLGIGAFLCTASKGVAGLGAALAFSFVLFPKSKEEFKKPFLGPLLFAALCFVAPFLLWAWKSYSSDPQAWSFLRYWKEQVLRSATSNRGNPFHSQSGSRFYYVEVLLKNLPHLFLPSLALCFVWAQKRVQLDTLERKFFYLNLVFFVSYFVPFSVVRFQLPHYLHPVYFCLALNTALLIFKWKHFAKVFGFFKWENKAWAFTLGIGMLLSIGFLLLRDSKLSPSGNRGQEFIAVRAEVWSAPRGSRMWLSYKDFDVYRMEAFSLWYFRGRNWSYLEKHGPELSPQAGDLLWDVRNSKVSLVE